MNYTLQLSMSNSTMRDTVSNPETFSDFEQMESNQRDGLVLWHISMEVEVNEYYIFIIQT